MYEDADAVRAALDEEDGPVVLVGHSYGGMVVTDAAAGHENVERLVYVTSVMPKRGETLAGLGAGREPGPCLHSPADPDLRELVYVPSTDEDRARLEDIRAKADGSTPRTGSKEDTDGPGSSLA